jgi:hypothetical protein
MWLPSLVGLKPETSAQAQVADPAPQLSEWASREQLPSTEELLETLGGAYGGDR